VLGPLASGGTAQEAAAFGEVVLISVPYRALEALGQALQAVLAGKIVLDACNPYQPDTAALIREIEACSATIWMEGATIRKAL